MVIRRVVGRRIKRMTARHNQSVPSSVNKGIIIGFNVSTTDATSTAVITSAILAAAGVSRIRDLHFKTTGDDGWAGLGKDAAAIASGGTGADIVPLFQDAFTNKENIKYDSFSIKRDASTNITVKGYAVVG